MTRALYFDCFAGASGDMILGALVDLGVDLEPLKRELASLGLQGYEIKASRVTRSGIGATKIDVEIDTAAQPRRKLHDILEMINRSTLASGIKSKSGRVFERLAEAEARVHNTSREDVHFHEVGAVDSIIDVVGAMIGLEIIGADRFFASGLRLGYGTVRTQHGELPVPAPGTAELLKGVPVYAGDIEGEFVTPTGAAILTTLCESFGAMPPLRIDRAGYGAGTRDPRGFPNALRLLTGELLTTDERVEIASAARSAGSEIKRVVVIETNIDDMSPQAYGFVMARAFGLGALDVYLTSAHMKKDRPAVLLTVLAAPERLDSIIDMLLAETTTLGVRYWEAARRVLSRRTETVETPYGPVRIKVAYDGDRTLHFQPEYEDCLRLAEKTGVPFLEVQAAASAGYRREQEASSKRAKEPEDINGELKEE